ncbi:D-alanyl-D-alanine carboxypeptidase/D-alanyl-D-alanine-endopeptidase [Streptomyces pluripotens]|uniref:D-alanyl-D-alanine carboxypeptidase/D-alanyl-D-alanine-endopeptidase n=1 Tax=Streptomyces pluripotens TaxID=1355015 RepID=A0A221NYR8_9ACTN|nr:MULTISPECIES: D-alanyl-D-alanine carboxypeptidase/D-alanyl-D-alanine-endopeptidase [Streptomyces]ARP70854.1 D-alanyl-D-alanine carboxypeptidase/D-alanyl-D-alanine-endopeptidase [Streptomyces pluripotens]ASN25110.1 D-alanyl-D-alanine carboxypeptidase/D-alanyl-D-alanine-endopeptidase [Streptomyces pluripotens]KIE25531.1 D-alanyl-D-alanine carboxypeptidase [Streptomyces sp. MUSC 125]
MVRLANAVRPRLARAATAAKPQVARLRRGLRPRPLHLPRSRTVRTWQYTAGAATVGLALAVGVVTVAGPWDADGQRTAERDRAAALEQPGGADHGSSAVQAGAPRPAPSAAPVLVGLGGASDVVGTRKAAPGGKPFSDVLGPLLDVSALGGSHAAVVVDVSTGKRLYGADPDEPLTPASTTKLATAVAALSALGADHRFTTRAALEPDTGELVLVGGGDPTLTARQDAGDWASLRTLATRTAEVLHKRGIDQVTLSYDTTLFSGPALHPIGVNENLARVSALTADEGRTDDSTSGPATRVTDPAASAAGKFAAFLQGAGIKTTSPGPSKATTRAEILATVSSPPLSALIERMLTHSDNDIAEALARQTALASGEPASFSGGAKAIATQLRKLGMPMSGASFHDGSGLNRADKVTADLLTALLAKAGDPHRPGLRPVLTGLPVAGFTGTLAHRYTDGAAGVVRAKTGTLTGVNTLAGTVVDSDGRLLAFAFLASDTTNPFEAQSALDRTATALAGCGCR